MGNDVFAQRSGELDACMEQANTQLAMNQCAGEELRQAESELRLMYGKVLTDAGVGTLAAEKIRLAQSAWIAYVSAYMEAKYPAANKEGEYGSRSPMEYAFEGSAGPATD